MKLGTIALIVALAGSTLVGCKKKKSADAPASSAPAAPAAPPADRKLAQVGVTVTLPGDANVSEDKMDMGGYQASIFFDGMSTFFIANVNEMSDDADAVMKHANAKSWLRQDKGADGTFQLAWTAPDVLDPSKENQGVAVRSKVGTTLVDCSSNGLSAAQAARLMEICATLR